MNTYVVAIPTYNRVKEVATKTLAVLHKYNIDPSCIYLFVANQEQCKLYEESVPRHLYGTIVVGVLGIANQRNFIREYFAEGEYIISMDDDITDVVFSNNHEPFQPLKSLHGLFTEAHDALLAKHLYIWGVYPVYNRGFMQDTITTDLRFIIGFMFGFINRHSEDLYLSPNIDGKEDYENTILYYIKDGGVMRFNNIHAKQKFYAPGGLGAIRDSQKSMDYMLQKYPQYITTKKRRNSDIVELCIRYPRGAKPPKASYLA